MGKVGYRCQGRGESSANVFTLTNGALRDWTKAGTDSYLPQGHFGFRSSRCMD